MATLRFKKDGTPFVDFRAHGKRYRPEFTRLKDAQKFLVLANHDPIEAYEYWMASIRPKDPKRDSSFLSLKEKIESFKNNYCAKRATSHEMRAVMDSLFNFLSQKYDSTDLDIRRLIFEDLEDFQSHLKKYGIRRKKAISNASVNRYFSTIKTFFKRQFIARNIPVDIAALIQNLQEDPVKRDMWRDESTAKLIEKLEEQKKDRVLIDIVRSSDWSPFGPIDYARLKWKDIDFKAGYIHTYRLKGRGKRVWDVPILPGYETVLKDILARHKAAGFGAPNDHVYLTEEWTPIDAGWVSTSLRRARLQAGIKEVPYSTRHKILTEIASKIDRDTASKFAGHASLRTTEKHYLGHDDADLKKKLNKVYQK